MFSNSLLRTRLFLCKLDYGGMKCLTSASFARTTSTLIGDKQKTMDDLHGPSFLTSLYWLFGKGYFQTTHQMQSKYGPLVVVNVADADLIEQVLRQEGRHPIRTDMPHWRGYRKLRNHAYGPLTEMGAEWQRIRSILNPRMLKPKHVSSYTNAINGVVSDFIEKVAKLRTTTGNEVMVYDVAGELYKFAFEGICSVLFETRMGCLNDVVPEETQKFIFSVGEMFRLSPIVILFPKSLWPYMPFWKHFVAVWDHLFKVADELVRKKMTEIQEMVKHGQPVEGEYLTHLLISEQMSFTEVLGSITELLLAGVDTTSNTISWALYHLAREPEIQQKLYEEVIGVCPGDKVPCMVPGNARVIAEREIVVGDHLFPKNRWIREQKQLNQHPFGSVPFGFGIRACLGRRVAELEMYLLLSQLIKHYEVRPDPSGKNVKPITRTLLVPATSIDLQFIDRQKEQEEPVKANTSI
ncbi:Sterol 26-hydroxylase, mitochondrial [Labeo rohita]|uniref:Sterol 26-hydroxylase, mitochondrial n=1 Tax=Labeo rohita TaxID=84645 RepID=A0ABQ8MCL5_LABRO|nr:Sterol 26-hydroxylase, mitochondrial [Labeo rohita]